MVVEAIVALGGAAGAVQLATGTFTPPVADLEPLGLTSWTLPGLWLLASVATPSAVAATLAWRRSARAPAAVLVSSGLLALELLVQIPFIGPSTLQAAFGSVAIAMAALAAHARSSGRWVGSVTTGSEGMTVGSGRSA